MKIEKMTEVFESYHQLLNEQGFVAQQCADYQKLAKNLGQEAVFGHLAYMSKKAIEHIKEGKIEKAHRWLGFIQGALWANNFFAINDMCQHNRPDQL